MRLLKKIGEGKYGKVYKVLEKKSTLHRAAKHINASKASQKTRILEEIEVLKKLDHPNLIRLIGAYEDCGNFVQVLEYLPGGELFERIVESPKELCEGDISNLVRQICEGCRHLEEHSVVHLDLKPDNIVCTSLNGFNIKIVDFGLARIIDENGKGIRVMEGTPEFASPEVINFEPISLTTDMWSIGAMTFVLLTGLSPFLGDNNQETYNNIVECRYTFDEPEFDLISESAKNFISSLLIIDQKLRLRASHALAHPWLLNSYDFSTSQPPPAEGRRKRLKSMVSRFRWQKAGRIAIACVRFRRGSSTTEEGNSLSVSS
ncbi:MYLK [Lepeophtheirus salmonis]|uniref:MYLK n=1 Tax=Lepeophtheirus salmonis TaxID=72036 RepID=A0A7R8CV30_LEPSM|nr:MYLK [Lepeophtheirus salmonis]CAF2941691.1 MYLK [Lepeophtheirus salmonis]